MNSRVALITFLDGGLTPDNSLPGVPGRPDNSLPGYSGPVDPGYGQGHPRPPHIGGGPAYPPNYPSTGPVFPPVTPDNSLPDSGQPPQISLPIYLPGGVTKPIEPEQKFELKYSVRFGWVIVAVEDSTAQPK